MLASEGKGRQTLSVGRADTRSCSSDSSTDQTHGESEDLVDGDELDNISYLRSMSQLGYVLSHMSGYRGDEAVQDRRKFCKAM